MELANGLQAVGALLGFVGAVTVTAPSLKSLNVEAQRIKASELEGGNDATRAFLDDLKAGATADSRLLVVRLQGAHVVGLVCICFSFLATLLGLLTAG